MTVDKFRGRGTNNRVDTSLNFINKSCLPK